MTKKKDSAKDEFKKAKKKKPAAKKEYKGGGHICNVPGKKSPTPAWIRREQW